MLVSYYLPGNSLAPPPGLRTRGDSAHTEEEQSLFDPFPYGWSPEEENNSIIVLGMGYVKLKYMLECFWSSSYGSSTRTPAIRERGVCGECTVLKMPSSSSSHTGRGQKVTAPPPYGRSAHVHGVREEEQGYFLGGNN